MMIQEYASSNLDIFLTASPNKADAIFMLIYSEICADHRHAIFLINFFASSIIGRRDPHVCVVWGKRPHSFPCSNFFLNYLPQFISSSPAHIDLNSLLNALHTKARLVINTLVYIAAASLVSAALR